VGFWLPKQGTLLFLLPSLAAVVPTTVVAPLLTGLAGAVLSQDYDRLLDVLQPEGRCWMMCLLVWIRFSPEFVEGGK
jgi:hypothetical protein